MILQVVASAGCWGLLPCLLKSTWRQLPPGPPWNKPPSIEILSAMTFQPKMNQQSQVKIPYILLMVQKSGVYQLIPVGSLIPLFIGVYTSKRWLARFLPSKQYYLHILPYVLSHLQLNQLPQPPPFPMIQVCTLTAQRYLVVASVNLRLHRQSTNQSTLPQN